jgi:hypothetical protein
MAVLIINKFTGKKTIFSGEMAYRIVLKASDFFK